MIIFISWTDNDDVAFRSRYFSVVGEEVQEYPEVINGKHVIGSSRIKPEHVYTLQDEFPDVIFTESLDVNNN